MALADGFDRLTELRIQAQRLLKQLRSSDGSERAQAATRFRRLRSLAGAERELAAGAVATVRLKHALAVIAEENGYDSWVALKAALEASPSLRNGSDRIDELERAGSLWYSTGLDVFLNQWFARHADARAALDRQGGFLLPYRQHFYVCQPGLIKALGLDPEDPDWRRIGFDCARPEDPEAFERLRARRRRALARENPAIAG